MSNDRLEAFNYHNIAFKRCADVVSLGRPDRLWFFRHHWFVKIGCWGKMGLKAQTCWTDLLAFRGVWNRSRILNFGPDRLFFRFSRALVHQYVIPLLRKIGEYRISCVCCSLSPCAMILLNYGLTNRNHRNACTLVDLSQNLVTNLLLQNSTPGHVLGSDLSLWPAFTKIQSLSGFQGQIFHCDLLLWSDTVLDSISLFQLVWAPLKSQCIHPTNPDVLPQNWVFVTHILKIASPIKYH